jgi:cell division protein FtsQ
MDRLRYLFAVVGVLLGFVAAMFCAFKADQLLAGNSHFTFAGPPEDGDRDPALRIEGLEYTSRARVVQTFAGDFGRSVYRVPLGERRRALLALDWVRDASVSRLWPDRVVVRVEERKPVAFVELQGGAGAHMALIDEEGVLLEMPARAHFDLPVLTGIRAGQGAADRGARVRRAMRLMQDLSPMAGSISEIDLNDPENLKVTEQIEDRAVVLLLGNRNFLSRMQNFLDHYPDIRRRLPNASAFDLRLDDRITAIEGAGNG